MNAMLTDEVLTRLLAGAAAGFEVPEPALEAPDEPVRRPLHRRGWAQGTAVAGVVAGALWATTLVGGGPGAVSRDTSARAVAPGLALAGPESTARFTPAVPAASVPRAPAPGGPSGGVARPAAAPAPDSGAARVVKSGELALVVDKGRVSPTLTAVQTAVEGLQGYVATSSTQELGSTPTGSVSFRIPVAGFDRAVARVRTLGGVTVRSASTSGRDVTAQYADTAAQLRSLRLARERFLTILGRANTIGETLTVQQRVDDVTGQIDRLEGQRQLLASQSDLATLAVSVSQKDDPAVQPAGKGEGGFTRAWREARHGFSSGVQGIVARSGRALLVLIVLAVLAAVLRVGWRLARRRLL